MTVANLSSEELALVCAALRYWRDEMAPTGTAIQQHYFEKSPIPAFDAVRIESLIERLHASNESSVATTPKENP